MDELWYQNVTYEDAKDMVKENLASTVESFIASGYWLKYIRDSRAYQADGYENLWDFAEAEFGLYISEASRAMSMNDKYSVDGNSPMMLEKYKQYNKSQLQEMLTMTDEQIKQITPDMRIKEIRELKNPVIEDTQIVDADSSAENNSIDLEQKQLKRWIEYFVCDKYVALKRALDVDGINGVSITLLKKIYGEDIPHDNLPESLFLLEQYIELINHETGEIVGRYEIDTVNTVLENEFEKRTRSLEIKMRPNLKGLLDAPYCGLCGAPLNSPETEHPSMACSKCGQAVSWNLYKKYYCDVATDTVETESEEEPIEDILTEIEVAPEQEEPLNIEFDTEELYKELDDDAIDGEYREVTEKDQKTDKNLKKCITGWSKYPEVCSCCGYNGASCCAQCEKGQNHNCNVRCGWVEEPYKPDTEVANPAAKINELDSLRSLLDVKKKELNQFLACEGIPENTIFEKKMIVDALVNMLRELEDIEDERVSEPEQPEFPKFKNNDERKAWLEDVEAWGLWYEDLNIQARYYKYDFPDGSRLVAVKYRYTCPEWMKGQKMFDNNVQWDGKYRNLHYHMIYSDEYRKKHTSEYDRYYTHATVSISILTDFIKEIAKRGKADE